MKKGTRYLILKYGENEVKDTPQKHMDVIEKDGFCWFGKMGRALSQKAKGIVTDSRGVFLYVRGRVFYGDVEEISEERKYENIPDYYREVYYKYEEYPSVYLKMTRLVEVNPDILNDLYVDTTQKTVAEGITHCMNPTIFASALCNKKI